jgi:hypothetical protein
MQCSAGAEEGGRVKGGSRKKVLDSANLALHLLSLFLSAGETKTFDLRGGQMF